MNRETVPSGGSLLGSEGRLCWRALASVRRADWVFAGRLRLVSLAQFALLELDFPASDSPERSSYREGPVPAHRSRIACRHGTIAAFDAGDESNWGQTAAMPGGRCRAQNCVLTIC